MSRARLSWRRFGAVLIKEFVQMRRDRLTFAMMVGMPLMQLLLFGYAINTDPQASADRGPARRPAARSRAASCRRSRTPAISRSSRQRRAARPRRPSCWRAARCSSCVTIPEDFARELLRGERPALLVEADATDPAATGNALGGARQL